MNSIKGEFPELRHSHMVNKLRIWNGNQKGMKMKYDIAIASTDGKLVNQHFGRADSFLIVSVDDEEKIFEYKEMKKVSPICHGGNHEEQELSSVTEVLKDCKSVLVSKIGNPSKEMLQNMGVEVYEVPGVIEESIQILWNKGKKRREKDE